MASSICHNVSNQHCRMEIARFASMLAVTNVDINNKSWWELSCLHTSSVHHSQCIMIMHACRTTNMHPCYSQLVTLWVPNIHFLTRHHETSCKQDIGIGLVKNHTYLYSCSPHNLFYFARYVVVSIAFWIFVPSMKYDVTESNLTHIHVS